MRITKAIITGGGRATRLRPITYTINKHLIPLANKPMIVHAIEKVARAGVTDIAINVNPGDCEIEQALGDGSKFGVHLRFFEQTGGPLGIAHVVKLAQDFVGNDAFLFYLGDNIILGDLTSFIEKFDRENLNCLLALSKVKEPNRFGVPVFSGDQLIRVEEKPSVPKSEYAVTGIYCYDNQFFSLFDSIQPSPRGEYEISDVHTRYLEQGCKVGWIEVTGWWKDTGKPDDLLEGNQLLLSELLRDNGSILGDVAGGAVIQGKVQIGKGTRVGERVLIRGPVAIGENCVLNDCYIGPFTSIGNNVKIYSAEIEHSVVFDGADIHCKKRIVESLIGKNAVIIPSHETLPSGHRLIVGDNAVVEL